MALHSNNIVYLNTSPLDMKWGLTATTAGYQRIHPGIEYPIKHQHPNSYDFSSENGRVLTEYQLIYISEGEGTFESKSSGKHKITPDTAIMLFPGEWHTYSPNKDTGWFEYWVGFKGNIIDQQASAGFFSKSRPLFKINYSSEIISIYENIVSYSNEERVGYQQMLAGLIQHLLAIVLYKSKNDDRPHSAAMNKIDEARVIMKENIDNQLSAEEIAKQLNVGYSWFRSKFKEVTGVAPAKYQMHLRYLRAQELLATTYMPISEIAYTLNFRSVSQFSSFFSNKEGVSPSEYRRMRITEY